MYKSFLVDYYPKAKEMAEAVEIKANEIESLGYKVVSFSITNSCKAIILAVLDEKSKII